MLGPDHPDVLMTRNNLAESLGEEGRLREAMEECQALLADRMRVLGPDHPESLTTRNNLASWLAEEGRRSRNLLHLTGERHLFTGETAPQPGGGTASGLRLDPLAPDPDVDPHHSQARHVGRVADERGRPLPPTEDGRSEAGLGPGAQSRRREGSADHHNRRPPQPDTDGDDGKHRQQRQGPRRPRTAGSDQRQDDGGEIAHPTVTSSDGDEGP